jgi:hypothetical protein
MLKIDQRGLERADEQEKQKYIHSKNLRDADERG